MAVTLLFDTFLNDVRYATRVLRRSPLFTATAGLSLAIGIGATTAVFTVANALLFRAPVGVIAPSRLVDIGVSRNGRPGAPRDGHRSHGSAQARLAADSAQAGTL